MPRRSIAAALLVPALLLTTIVGWAGPAPAAPDAPGQQIRLEGPISEGVYLRERVDHGPVTSVSVEVAPDAPVAFVPVLSGNRIDGGLEHTSSMCHRVGGVVCINANYATCPSCGHPFGGIVQDGVILRSPTPYQDQVSVINGRLTLQPWMWSAGLWSRKGGRSLDFHGVNTGMSPGGIYLYTRAYGDSTGAPPGAYELVVRAPKPLWTGIGQRQKVEFLGLRNQGDTTIPPDGAVITAYGSSVPELRHWVDLHKRMHVELVVNTPGGLEQSFAGHPIILRDGRVQPMDPADGKVTRRHPRSIIGWNDAGKTWVVAVDGRQSNSVGMTLPEAARHLRSLGAEHAVNFDGGGSTAMATVCPSPSGWCLRNRPSDGRERSVWVALALVPRARPAPPAPAAKPKPKPAPEAKPAPEPDAATGKGSGGGGGAPPHAADAEGGPDAARGGPAEGRTAGPGSKARGEDAVLWTPAPAPGDAPEPRGTVEVPSAERGDGPGPAATPEAGAEHAAGAGPMAAEVDDAGAVVPAGQRPVGIEGLIDAGRRVPPLAVATAVVLVLVEAASLTLLLRRRRRRRQWRQVTAIDHF